MEFVMVLRAHPNHIEWPTVVGVVSLYLRLATYQAWQFFNSAISERIADRVSGNGPVWVAFLVPAK